MSILIDTHCHLDLFKDIQLNKQKENELGIKTISVTNAPSFFEPNNQLFKDCSNIRIALGLHPQLVYRYKEEITTFQSLLKVARYIGEIGLDGSPDLKDNFSMQKEIFEKILTSVRIQDYKILSVHSRNASTDTITILDRYLKGTNNKVILHWYSGNLTDLETAIMKGFYFSINHKMISTDKGRTIIKNIPQHLLLTETDAPFTFDGTIKDRYKSLTTTVNGIAEVIRKSPEDVRKNIFENFRSLISL